MTKHPEEDNKWKKLAEEEAQASLDTQAKAGAEPESAKVTDHDRSELVKLQAQLQEKTDLTLRLQAEMENVRARARRELEGAHKYGVEKLVRALIPVVDSLDRSLASAASGASDPVLEGVKMTLSMLLKTVGEFGVTAFDPLGQPFDPNFHEAMGMQASPDGKSGIILAVFQKGYSLHDRVVSHAKVIVST